MFRFPWISIFLSYVTSDLGLYLLPNQLIITLDPTRGIGAKALFPGLQGLGKFFLYTNRGTGSQNHLLPAHENNDSLAGLDLRIFRAL
jgi:hypothetical protein